MWRGRTEIVEVHALDGSPRPFGDYRVTSSSGSSYTVEVRSLGTHIFGALAFGIGTSESEHVLATQTRRAPRPNSMRVAVDDPLPAGCTGKDLILAIIGQIGTAGGTGHIIEYSGRAIRDLSMEGRMTVSNMTIEGGARAGLVAPAVTSRGDRGAAPEPTFSARRWQPQRG